MDIAALSMSISNYNVAMQASVAMMKMAMETAQVTSKAIVEMAEGSTIDIKV